jgi:hypothetical protein
LPAASGSYIERFDLGFPEFTRHVRTLESELATTILSRYSAAASYRGTSAKKLARIIYDGSHNVDQKLARALIEAAGRIVGWLASPSLGEVF